MAETVSTDELKKKIDSNADFVLVDVLSESSYGARHIPGAKNIPKGEIGERAPKELPDKEKEIIVYCSSSTCAASPQAAEKLKEMGYTNVKHYKDGLAGWQEAGNKFEGQE